MRRSELRRINRRRARRKARQAHDGETNLKSWMEMTSGNRKRVNLWIRTGGARHQPRRVREIVTGKRRMLTRAEKEKEDNFIASILKATFRLAFGADEKDVFDDLHAELRGEKAKPFPAEMPDDPLPEHEPDGYWSGHRNLWPFGKEMGLEYAEGREAIADMAVRHRQKYPFTFRTSKRVDIESADDFRKYIERVYTVELIHPNGDNRIRYQLLTFDDKEPVGLLCCRCGDCGKIAAGLLHGNPDMGDYCYQIMHRKDWFCTNFGWTYMGGHGSPGGRRMICPECSKIYAAKEAAEKTNKKSASVEDNA